MDGQSEASPWAVFTGPVGYPEMAKAADVTIGTIRNWVEWGLLPPPTRIGPNRRRWPPEVATEALRQLPAKVEAWQARKRQVRRPGRPAKVAS